MKLDKYDLALVNAACKDGDTARPMLQCLHFTKGRVEATDGFMLAVRDIDLKDGEEKPEALLNIRMLKRIKPDRRQETILSITDSKAKVNYVKDDGSGKPAEFAPSISFGTLNATFPNTDQLWASAEKKAHIAISVGLLKKLLACLPADGILKIGITEPTDPLEFECSNMDRPIRGLLLPMLVAWKGHDEPNTKEHHQHVNLIREPVVNISRNPKGG